MGSNHHVDTKHINPNTFIRQNVQNFQYGENVEFEANDN